MVTGQLERSTCAGIIMLHDGKPSVVYKADAEAQQLEH